MQNSASVLLETGLVLVGYCPTVTVAVFDVTPPAVAVIVEVPTATAVAKPVLEIVATELGTEFQVEVAVTSPVEPSL